MLRRILCLVSLLVFASCVTAQEQQKTTEQKTETKEAKQPVPPKTHLKVGMAAPNFELFDTGRKKVSLADFKGKKNVVLAFYVLAFTGG